MPDAETATASVDGYISASHGAGSDAATDTADHNIDPVVKELHGSSRY